MLPLTQQVHANRLRYLKRLLRQCPSITWMLINADRSANSWIHAITESFRWMQMHYDRPRQLPDTLALDSWIAHIQLDTSWFGRIKKTACLALHYHMAQAENSVWQHNFDASFTAAGATLPMDPHQKTSSERWQCDLCAKVFTSTRALAMHASREHGYRKKVRYYAAGTTCPVCCQLFHKKQASDPPGKKPQVLQCRTCMLAPHAPTHG